MKSFRIKNIKSFVDSGEVEIAPITIFVGRNSCGKSSLIRFPAVLSQTFISETDSPLKFYGKLLDYGNYDDVIYGHGEGDISFEVKYIVDLNRMGLMSTSMSRRFGLDHRNRERIESEVVIDVTLGRENDNQIVKSFTLLKNSEKVLRLAYDSNNEYIFSLFMLFKDGHLIKSEREYSFRQVDVEFEGIFPLLQFEEVEKVEANADGNIESLHISTARLFEYRRRIRLTYDNGIRDKLKEADDADEELFDIYDTFEYLRYVISSFSRLMNYEANELSYIGPFRDNPEREYRDQEKRSSFVGTRGENISTLLINDYHKDSVLIKKVSEWLWNSMRYRISIKKIGSSLFQIVVEDENGFQSNILDVGYGISQVLPIVAEIFKPQDRRRRRYMDSRYANHILIVEQPELHLHPAAQSDLAELLVEFVSDPQKRILVETHSEHLIRKLQVCVANPEIAITKDMVKIYYVDKRDGSNEASIQEMKLCDDGRFEKEWPSGFFDKAFQLTMELARQG